MTHHYSLNLIPTPTIDIVAYDCNYNGGPPNKTCFKAKQFKHYYLTSKSMLCCIKDALAKLGFCKALEFIGTVLVLFPIIFTVSIKIQVGLYLNTVKSFSTVKIGFIKLHFTLQTDNCLFYLYNERNYFEIKFN